MHCNLLFFYFVSCKQIGIIIQRHLMQILGSMQLFNQVVKHHIYQCHFNYDVLRPTNLHKYNQFERRSFLSINSVIALNRSKNSFNVSLATLYNRSMYQQLNHLIRIWQSISIIFSSFAIYDQILFIFYQITG